MDDHDTGILPMTVVSSLMLSQNGNVMTEARNYQGLTKVRIKWTCRVIHGFRIGK